MVRRIRLYSFLIALIVSGTCVLHAELLVNTNSEARVPDRLCLGSTFTVDARSKVVDTINVEIILNPLSTPPLAKYNASSTNGVVTISNLQAPNNVSNLTIWVIVRDITQISATPPDTNKGVIRIVQCCGNTTINGTFAAISTGGSCEPVGYETDFDFGFAPLGGGGCRPLFTTAGQIASESSARFKSPAFEGFSHSISGDFFLFGDPEPNVKKKAWKQTQPVYAGRPHTATAWVRNVEKILRFPGPATNLRMLLVATQGTVVDTIARTEGLQFNADPGVAWKELTGTYVPAVDGEIELSVIVHSVTTAPMGYGFGIDDISFMPVRRPVDAGSSRDICAGQSAQLNPSIPPDVTAYWRPANGLNDTLDLAPVVNPAVTTTYVLVVRDSFGCLDSGSVTLTVREADSVTIAVSDSVLCGGDSVLLFAPDTLLSYQWFFNSFPISGANTDWLYVSLPGVYTLQSTSPTGCPLGSNTIVVYQQQPAVVTAVLDTSDITLPMRIGTIVQIPIIITRTLPPGAPLIPIRTEVLVEVNPSVMYAVSGFDSQRAGIVRGVRVTTEPFIDIDTIVIGWQVALGRQDSAFIRLSTETPVGNCAVDDSKARWSLPIEICRANGDRLIHAGDPIAFIDIYAQPADEELNVDAYCLERGRTTLDVISQTGALMYQAFVEVDGSGIYTFHVPTSSLPSGAYQLLLRGPNTTARSVMRVLH